MLGRVPPSAFLHLMLAQPPPPAVLRPMLERPPLLAVPRLMLEQPHRLVAQRLMLERLHRLAVQRLMLGRVPPPAVPRLMRGRVHRRVHRRAFPRPGLVPHPHQTQVPHLRSLQDRRLTLFQRRDHLLLSPIPSAQVQRLCQEAAPSSASHLLRSAQLRIHSHHFRHLCLLMLPRSHHPSPHNSLS